MGYSDLGHNIWPYPIIAIHGQRDRSSHEANISVRFARNECDRSI